MLCAEPGGLHPVREVSTHPAQQDMHTAALDAIDEVLEQDHAGRIRIASALESQDDRARVLVDSLLDPLEMALERGRRTEEHFPLESVDQQAIAAHDHREIVPGSRRPA